MEFVVGKKYLKKRPPAIQHFKELNSRGRDARVQSASTVMTTEQVTPSCVRSVSSVHVARPRSPCAVSSTINQTNDIQTPNTTNTNTIMETTSSILPTLPIDDTPHSLAKDIPTSPAKDIPTSPAKDIPTSPAKDAPTSPAKDAPTSPAKDAPTSPAKDEPTSPAKDAPTSPAKDAPNPDISTSVTQDTPTLIAEDIATVLSGVPTLPPQTTPTSQAKDTLSQSEITSPAKAIPPCVVDVPNGRSQGVINSKSHRVRGSNSIAKHSIPKTAPTTIYQSDTPIPEKFKIAPNSAMPGSFPSPYRTFLEVKRLIIDRDTSHIIRATATEHGNSAGKKINRNSSSKGLLSDADAEGRTIMHAEDNNLDSSEYSTEDSSQVMGEGGVLPVPTLPLLHARTALPDAAGSLTVAGTVISPHAHTDRKHKKVIHNLVPHESFHQPQEQLHKIDYTRSKHLFTAISNFERRRHSKLHTNFWDQQARASLKALDDSRRQKELVRMHRATLCNELMELAKSYSMYYSHLRLQDFQGRGYRPSLRVAWYSKYCNHLQMKEDFREDAQKVMEDWLHEKTCSLRRPQ